MHPIDFIKARRSIGKLSLPMPSSDELKIALQTAMSAPDHMQLKPWQLVVMTNKALDDFGKVLLKAHLAKEPDSDDITKTRICQLPKRAPMVIMVATNTKSHPKVPKFEQLLSTGALAQNLLLALQALGYQSIWRTGLLANEPAVKAYFNIADKDLICGFIYVGSSDVVMPARDEVDLNQFVKFWSA